MKIKTYSISIKLEILEYSYWEHFKMAKDIALVLPIDHPKRKKLEKEINEMATEINELKAVVKKKKIVHLQKNKNGKVSRKIRKGKP